MRFRVMRSTFVVMTFYARPRMYRCGRGTGMICLHLID
jgi:hypothetical protein